MRFHVLGLPEGDLRVCIEGETGSWERRQWRRDRFPMLTELEKTLDARAANEDIFYHNDDKEAGNCRRGENNARVMRKAAFVIQEAIGVVTSNYRTVCTISLVHGDHEHELVRGEAYLSPEDEFNEEEGQQIALERALTQLDDEAAGIILAAYVRRPSAPLPAWNPKRSPEARQLALLAAKAMTGKSVEFLEAFSQRYEWERKMATQVRERIDQFKQTKEAA